MAFKEITAADLQGKGNVGKPDTPGYSTAEMQRVMDEIPREVIVPAFNALVAALMDTTAAGSTGAKVPATLPTSTASTVQGILNALAKQADDHLNDKDNPHEVSAGQVESEIPAELPTSTASTVQAVLSALAVYTREHKQDKDNPHSVTAEQVDAYTKSQTDEAIDKKIVDIGSGDMAKNVYDPNHKELPIYSYIDDAAGNLQTQIDNQQTQIDAKMLRATYDPQGRESDIFAAIDGTAAMYTAKLTLDDWTACTGTDLTNGYAYQQTATLTKDNSNAPTVTANSTFVSGVTFTPTGVVTTDETLAEVLAIINAGKTVSGAGNVTVYVTEKPTAEINARWAITT